jgi:hypothetical protein
LAVDRTYRHQGIADRLTLGSPSATSSCFATTNRERRLEPQRLVVAP